MDPSVTTLHSVLLPLDATSIGAARLESTRHVALRHEASWLRRAAPHHAGDLDIVQYLRLHGVESTLHRDHAAPTDAGEVLLSFASALRANLLAVGCYGHHPTRELVLGGASRTVLGAMTLPVLMAH